MHQCSLQPAVLYISLLSAPISQSHHSPLTRSWVVSRENARSWFFFFFFLCSEQRSLRLCLLLTISTWRGIMGSGVTAQKPDYGLWPCAFQLESRLNKWVLSPCWGRRYGRKYFQPNPAVELLRPRARVKTDAVLHQTRGLTLKHCCNWDYLRITAENTSWSIFLLNILIY